MSDKPSGLDQLSESDQAIYDYLDDMFREPDQTQESESDARQSVASEIKSNQRLSAQSSAQASTQASSLLKAVPQSIAEPAQLHVNPNIMTLQAFKERPPQSLIPSPIIVPMPANELLPSEDAVEPEVEAKSTLSDTPEEKQELLEETELLTKTESKEVKRQVATEQSEVPPPAIEATADMGAVERTETQVDPSDIESESANLAVHLPPTDEGWSENGRPDWAQDRFECLIFCVGGLKLAVPLVTLGAIHQIDRKFNLLPGQDDWFIGILRTSTGNLKVIDTALCVMPERYKPEHREGLQFVISLHGYEWGLSCHEVSNSITLEPEEVRWRTQRGKRPWLAGTVVDHMCALIDPSGFHRVIERAEKPAV